MRLTANSLSSASTATRSITWCRVCATNGPAPGGSRVVPTSRSPRFMPPASPRSGAREGRCEPIRCFSAHAARARDGSQTPRAGEVEAGILVDAAGAWADSVAATVRTSRRFRSNPGAARWCKLRVGRTGLARPAARDRPARKASTSRARATMSSGSARSTRPLSNHATPRPRKSTSPMRSTASSARSTGRSRRSNANGRASEASRPIAAMQFGFDPLRSVLFLVRGAGRHGHPDRPGCIPACVRA